MKTFQILLLLSVFVAVIYTHRYDDYEDEDYDYRPPRRRPSRQQFRRGDYRGSSSRSRGYGGGYDRHGIKNYGFSFGGKGRAKSSQKVSGDGRIFSQRAALDLDRARDRDGEAGGVWDSESLSFGGRGSSRGRTRGNGMVNTWVGGGTGKADLGHDLTGEAGGAFD